MLLTDLRQPGVSCMQKSRVNRTLHFDETVLDQGALLWGGFACPVLAFR